ncbi:uncharacterized protein LOC115900090 [Rhinopithecus roxellana]|uniref:uncharacterized protein LOC115900090 n=1 Tax=Rhinopithecus roxellana TaxID=61622 RepID=UPI00123732E6|nr:uncharacterized protein LOC115900090 [Rhinopithecus roxellana]
MVHTGGSMEEGAVVTSAPGRSHSNPLGNLSTISTPERELDSQADYGQGLRRWSQSYTYCICFSNCHLLRKSNLHRIGPQLGLLRSTDESRFGGLEKEQRDGLHGSATSSSAELGEASSGKHGGIWIHFLVVQTVAFPQWAGMETPITHSSRSGGSRGRDQGHLSFHKYLEDWSHLAKVQPHNASERELQRTLYTAVPSASPPPSRSYSQ